MYQTRIFALEELTKPFFRDSRVCYAPKPWETHGVRFLTEKKVGTPLGKLRVELDYLHVTSNDFTIWFLYDKKKRKENWPYMFCNIRLGVNKLEKRIASNPEVIFELNEELPKELKDVTLEGVKLSELKEGVGESSPKNLSIYSVDYFVKNMLSRMELLPLICFEDQQKLEKERRKIMSEKYRIWEQEWNKILIRIGKDYASYKL